jgi:hypothetical protein
MDVPSPAWLKILYDQLFWISSFGVLIPFGIGLWRWRYLSPAGRIIVYYFGFWTVEAFVDQWSRKVLHTNIYLYHVTVLVETWLLGWAYYQVLDLKPVRRVMLPLAGLFSLVAFADAFWIAGLHQFNTVTRVVQVVLMLAMIMLYFEQWVRDMRTDSPWRSLMFMTSVGLAVYYTGSLMSYLLKHIGPYDTSNAVMSIIIDSSYNVALVLMTIGLWRETRPQVPHYHRTTTG